MAGYAVENQKRFNACAGIHIDNVRHVLVHAYPIFVRKGGVMKINW